VLSRLLDQQLTDLARGGLASLAIARAPSFAHPPQTASTVGFPFFEELLASVLDRELRGASRWTPFELTPAAAARHEPEKG